MALQYTIGLPGPKAQDVNVREMSLTKDGGTPEVTNLAADATEFKFIVQPGVQCSLVLVDIDKAGNRSEPSDPLSFTATDNIPPGKPGELSVTNVEEVPDP